VTPQACAGVASSQGAKPVGQQRSAGRIEGLYRPDGHCLLSQPLVGLESCCRTLRLAAVCCCCCAAGQHLWRIKGRGRGCVCDRHTDSWAKGIQGEVVLYPTAGGDKEQERRGEAKLYMRNSGVSVDRVGCVELLERNLWQRCLRDSTHLSCSGAVSRPICQGSPS
jgi:hypothetical protein